MLTFKIKAEYFQPNPIRIVASWQHRHVYADIVEYQTIRSKSNNLKLSQNLQYFYFCIPLSGRAAFMTPMHPLYSTRPHGLLQAIFWHTRPDLDLGP